MCVVWMALCWGQMPGSGCRDLRSAGSAVAETPSFSLRGQRLWGKEGRQGRLRNGSPVA